MNIIDDTPVQQPQPGSLGFIPPVSPEMPVETISPNTESVVAVEAISTVEREPEQENEPLYEAPTPQTDTQKAAAPIAMQPATTPAPKIVDKSGELTKTHHIQHTLDKLTALADLDEEKFIEEVESAHGHK